MNTILLQLAQAAPAAPPQCGGGSALSSYGVMFAMFGVIYFILIRPQQKRMKQHQAMLTSLKTGDQVVTRGGALGKVVAVEDKFVTLEIAERVKVKYLKSSVESRESGPAASDKASSVETASST